MGIVEAFRRWAHQDGPGPIGAPTNVSSLFSAAGAAASPAWTAQDFSFDAELKRRLGAKYAGFTGQGYANRYGGGFVYRPSGKVSTTYVLHHTAGAPAWGGGDVWRYHVQSRGWNTAGYHVLINPVGKAELLIPPSMMSYGAAAANPWTVHVSCHGNYVSSEPSAAMLATIYQVFLALDVCYGGKPWRGHRELPGSATACPGRLLGHLARMRGAAYGAATPPKPSYP